MKTNYHTHLYLCHHASGDIEDYVTKAINNNYQELGISDHGPLLEDLRRRYKSGRMTFDEYYQIYLPDLEKNIKKYPNIRILKAIEIEYFNDMQEIYPKFLEELDYLILGQHFITRKDEFVTVYAKDFTKEDVLTYASIIEKALKTGYFKILAHPDLIMWAYPHWDDLMISVSRRIITAAIQNNVYLEFNANGLRRERFLEKDGTYNFIYPRMEFWKLVKEEFDYDKIIINDDCHSLNDFDDLFTKEAKEICQNLKLKVADKIEL